MSTPSNSTKPSTTAADNVAKEQHDVPKSGTVEQDTAGDDSLQGSLDAKIASELGDHPAATSDGSSPATNVVPDVDLSVLEPDIPVLQDAGNGEIWIPKGGHDKPNAPQQGQPVRPTRPKPNRDD